MNLTEDLGNHNRSPQACQKIWAQFQWRWLIGHMTDLNNDHRDH